MSTIEQLAAAGYEATVVHPGPTKKGRATILVVGDGVRTYVREDDGEHVEMLVSASTAKVAKSKRPLRKGPDA